MLWLAWAAMVTLMREASKLERRRWHRYFHRLDVIERDMTMNEEERGRAFIALLKEAWPAVFRRGRPSEDKSDFVEAADRIEAYLADTWKKREAVRRAAVVVVEQETRINLDLICADGCGTSRQEVLNSRTARQATVLILSHIYEEPAKTTEQALRRARAARKGQPT
jgi:hypothetical protein